MGSRTERVGGCRYDVAMSNDHDPRMAQYPLFVSYPRSGAHWLNCVMELYFDRPRLREGRVTFLDSSRDDWMWFHDHDSDLSVSHDNVLYLYRDPEDVIYSYLKAERSKFNERTVDEIARELRAHYTKYLGPNGVARSVIRYESCRSDLGSQFEIICDFFGESLDRARLDEVSARVTRDSIVERANEGRKREDQYMNRKMLSSKYEKDRDGFRADFGDRIARGAIPAELSSFFAPGFVPAL